MINNELMELRSNSLVMESLHDIAMDLPASERSKYVQIATEAMVTNPDTQVKILMKLSKQTESLQQIDLEQCRKSMGDITKYQYYDALVKAMEIINESEFTSDIPNVIRMNKLHAILLDNRDDFNWGYKKNDLIIIKMYTLLTRLLFIMIDLSISEYVKKLEMNFKFNSKLTSATPNKVSKVVVDADRMIKMFENGEWRLVVNSAKKSAAKQTARAIDEMNGTEPTSSMASEAFIPKTINIPGSNKKGTDGVISTAGVVSSITNKFNNLAKGTKDAVIVLGIVMVIMISYRHIAFFVAKLGAKFANVFRHCAELIKSYGIANRDQSSTAVEKQNKLYNFMIGTADKIEAFFTKAEIQADAEIKEANRKDLNTSEITTIDSVDFGF